MHFPIKKPSLLLLLQITFLMSLPLCSIQAKEPDLLGFDTHGFVFLLKDNFHKLTPGQLGSVVGAHTEYHYLPESAPKGDWSITSFRSDIGSQLAWKAFDFNGLPILKQVYDNVKTKHAHPMMIAGDQAWRDYFVSVWFVPESTRAQSGMVFRYRNDRCYYFFGVNDGKAILKMVQHATAFRKPYEKILAEKPFSYKTGKLIIANVIVKGKQIYAGIENGPKFEVEDETYPNGQIGLMADVPTRYHKVLVGTNPQEKKRVETEIKKREDEELKIQRSLPKPKVWKKIKTEGFGVGRNLRFGDLNGNGQLDFLIGQVCHHGPKDRNSELSCLTAMTFDGEKLWQIGEPDPWKDHLTNDVAFQIHDIDSDGQNEVIYCMDMKIVVADGATGKVKYSALTPAMPATAKAPYNKFPRILGDSIYFCDFRGTGKDTDLVIKDRYQHFWVLDDKLNLLWKGLCNTGHYPYAEDVDNDGKDELAIGYSLYDDDGSVLFTLDGQLKDHADGVAVVKFNPEKSKDLRVLYAASDEGMVFTDINGQIIKHHFLGHVQNPAVADFRPDLPGLETVSINYWGNQGIIHLYDSSGDIYHDFEPCQHGSMCLPVNWSGKPGEFFVLSANVEQGGMFDGWGRRAVRFPNDGHPEMCNAVMNITGDDRDEIVVWDPNELWVYTQSQFPKVKGTVYRTERNPLYNYSNYQTTVSLPVK